MWVKRLIHINLVHVCTIVCIVYVLCMYFYTEFSCAKSLYGEASVLPKMQSGCFAWIKVRWIGREPTSELLLYQECTINY